jgi:hypothetical protein
MDYTGKPNYPRPKVSEKQQEIIADISKSIQDHIPLAFMGIQAHCYKAIGDWQVQNEKYFLEVEKMENSEIYTAVHQVKEILIKNIFKGEDQSWLKPIVEGLDRIIEIRFGNYGNH